MKLPHPALLRPLAPKHRPHVIELSYRLDLEHLRFDIRTHDTRGPLRPEGQLGRLRILCGAAVAILKGIHFLFHDIGGLADGTAKQLGLFHDRNADLGKTIVAEDLARR